jgi:hypothetical protein
MAAGLRRRKDFAIKVRERFRERVPSFVCMGGGGRIHENIIADQELLKHFPGGNEKIAIATLTPELERELGGCLRARAAICAAGGFDVGDNGDLEFSFDTFSQLGKSVRSTDPREIGTRGNSHIGLERNVILNYRLGDTTMEALQSVPKA